VVCVMIVCYKKERGKIKKREKKKDGRG